MRSPTPGSRDLACGALALGSSLRPQRHHWTGEVAKWTSGQNGLGGHKEKVGGRDALLEGKGHEVRPKASQ